MYAVNVDKELINIIFKGFLSTVVIPQVGSFLKNLLMSSLKDS